MTVDRASRGQQHGRRRWPDPVSTPIDLSVPSLRAGCAQSQVALVLFVNESPSDRPAPAHPANRRIQAAFRSFDFPFFWTGLTGFSGLNRLNPVNPVENLRGNKKAHARLLVSNRRGLESISAAGGLNAIPLSSPRLRRGFAVAERRSTLFPYFSILSTSRRICWIVPS